MYKVHLKLKDEEGNYILDNISDRGFLVKRDSVKKEWFLVEHKDYIKMLMEAAEEHFELLEIDDESTEDDDNEIEEDSNE